MSRSFFNAFSGIAAYQRSLHLVADNIANANTTAYKRSEGSFTDLLYAGLQEKRYSVDAAPGAPPPFTGKGSQMFPVTRVFEQGPLLLSERPLDIAIEGRGYFQVIRPDGSEVYTRRGSFHLDDEGTLVTDQGYTLAVDFDLEDIILGTLGISPDGTLSATGIDGAPEELGQITLFVFVNENGLLKAEHGLFEATEMSGEAVEFIPGAEAGLGRLRQYYLEGANVDLGAEMVQLIASQRAFQGNVRSLITADELKALTLLVRG